VLRAVAGGIALVAASAAMASILGTPEGVHLEAQPAAAFLIAAAIAAVSWHMATRAIQRFYRCDTGANASCRVGMTTKGLTVTTIAVMLCTSNPGALFCRKDYIHALKP